MGLRSYGNYPLTRTHRKTLSKRKLLQAEPATETMELCGSRIAHSEHPRSVRRSFDFQAPNRPSGVPNLAPPWAWAGPDNPQCREEGG